MTQPFAQKQIELGFFVRLMHVRVGVGINPAKAPRMLGADDFGHACVVVYLNLEHRHRQPWQAVFLADLQGGGVRAVEQYFDRLSGCIGCAAA